MRGSQLLFLDLDKQVTSDGATWLDRELASANRTPLAQIGFGREVSEAMDRRRQSLVDMGHATRLDDGRIRASKDLLQRLVQAEVARVGRMMAAERGLSFMRAQTGEHVSGRLVGEANLASGRFAMIDDGVGFQLVPWQPALEKRIGQHITGMARDSGGIEWNFGREARDGALSVFERGGLASRHQPSFPTRAGTLSTMAFADSRVTAVLQFVTLLRSPTIAMRTAVSMSSRTDIELSIDKQCPVRFRRMQAVEESRHR
nr:DUF3363 domain-containing protein [Mesorhizobium sp.]